jgi:thioredoxin-like negative regulator of GroEL
VIERLLAAERALEGGQLAVADRLYEQVEAADPRNAIAMTGRAKVAQAQGDLEGARRHVARAIETDPDDRAARSLAASLETPGVAAAVPAPVAATPPSTPAAPPTRAATPPGAPPAPRRSIANSIGRFLRRLVGR